MVNAPMETVRMIIKVHTYLGMYVKWNSVTYGIE